MSEWPLESAHVDLGSSTLTCHVAIFKQLTWSDDLPERLKLINGAFQSIHDEYGKSTQRLDYLSDSNPVSILEMWWRSIPVTLRFILHTEIVSLTIYLHVDRASQYTDHDDIVGSVPAYFKNITAMISGGSYDQEHLTMCHTLLYETIWSTFFNERKRIPSPSWSPPHGLEESHIIANFHGLIIRTSSAAHVDNDYIVNSLEPFLCCKPNVTMDDLAICEMKGGRALYFSRLAKLPDDPPHYLLVTKSLNTRELDDLVATGHRLGVLRFAAIFPRSQLAEAAHKLRRIDRAIALVFDSISRKGPITQIQDSVNDVKITKFLEVNNLFPGGVRNRLRQSILYKTSFDALLQRLEISRHQHYKTYGDATNNALAPTLDRIKQLLSNYDNIDADYYSLCQLVSSEVTAKRNTAIEEIQKYGEVILFVFPVPYYAGSLVEHTLIESVAEPLVIVIWILSVAYAGVKFSEARRDYDNGQKNILKKCAIAVFLASAMGVICYLFYKNETLKVQKTWKEVEETEQQKHLKDTRRDSLFVNNDLRIPLFTLVQVAQKNVELKKHKPNRHKAHHKRHKAHHARGR